jgi:hypothetical protein
LDIRSSPRVVHGNFATPLFVPPEAVSVADHPQ